jgi:hypothetical protein
VFTVGAYLVRRADRHGDPQPAWAEEFELR